MNCSLKGMATRSEEVSHHYDKEALLSEHQHLRSSIRINTPHQIHPQAVQIQSGKLIELNKFEAIRISDLSPNDSNQNKLIYSTQISPLAVAEPICFIVEDEYENACRVILFALADTSHLVKGVKLAFSNPVYRMAFDGKYSLIVHNISDVFILGMNQSVESYLKLSIKCDSELSIASTAGESNQENHEQIHQRRLEQQQQQQQQQKQQQTYSIDLSPYNVPADDGLNLSEIGNKLFKEGRYSQAIVQYTSAIEINDKTGKFYSNRAMCYNKLEEFENALSDFQKANLLDPDCVKYQYWVALTWSRIGNHRLSLDLLKKIRTKDELYISSVNKQISQEESYQQNIGGVFDFERTKLKFLPRSLNDIADYIGPIQILNSPNKGRGIFTTRNVKKGDNLCVIKATNIKNFIHNNCPCRICIHDKFFFISQDKTVHTELIEKAKRSKLTTVRIISLCDRSITNVNIDLYSGCGYEFAKNFDTTPYPMDKLLSLAVDNIGLGFKQYDPDDLVQSFGLMFDNTLPPFTTPNSTFAGIWLLPCFINHSCIPNVVKIYFDNICIVRAITDILEGEEVFSNYIPLSIFPKVEDRCAFLNFSCTCKLCEFERTPDVRKIILQILHLEDHLYSCGLDKCIVHPIQVEEITLGNWIFFEVKMSKLVKQLRKKQTDDILSGSFLTSIVSLLVTKPSEIDGLDLLLTYESYFSFFELEPYFLFWMLYNAYLFTTHKRDDPRFHYAVMKINELRQFFL